MMHRISHWLSRHAAALFFLAALILYDFSAYLTTDLIQPGSCTWCGISMLMWRWLRPR